jgi:hypothetical protein
MGGPIPGGGFDLRNFVARTFNLGTNNVVKFQFSGCQTRLSEATLPTVLTIQNLKSAGIPASSWSKYLNRGCTVVALTGGTIAGGTTLAEYKEKLGAHGIQDIHLHRITNNKTTTETIRGGRLPEMIARLKKETSIPTEKWYGILALRSSSKALLDDTFRNMILILRSTGIQSEHFYKILSSDTAASMLLEDKPAFQRVIESLRLSGMDVGTWHTMLCAKPVVGAISKGALPKIIRNLNLAHCHKNG